MPQKIDTTTRELKQGVPFRDTSIEVSWESTGHLSVRLLDASGSVPLARRKVTVDVPREGTVTLETDDDGELVHPDVPFQDYDLDLDGVKVTVPTVGEKGEVHERHAVAVPMGFIHAVVSDPRGFPLADEPLAVEFPSGERIEVRTDDAGVLGCRTIDPGEGDTTITHACGRAVTRTMASPQTVVPLRLEPES